MSDPTDPRNLFNPDWTRPSLRVGLHSNVTRTTTYLEPRIEPPIMSGREGIVLELGTVEASNSTWRSFQVKEETYLVGDQRVAVIVCSSRGFPLSAYQKRTRDTRFLGCRHVARYRCEAPVLVVARTGWPVMVLRPYVVSTGGGQYRVNMTRLDCRDLGAAVRAAESKLKCNGGSTCWHLHYERGVVSA